MATNLLDFELGVVRPDAFYTINQLKLLNDCRGLEISIGAFDLEKIKSKIIKADPNLTQYKKGVSALFACRLDSYGISRNQTKSEIESRIKFTLENSVRLLELDEWVILNEFLTRETWMARKLGSYKDFVLSTYEEAFLQARGNSMLAIRDLFGADWGQLIEVLKDPQAKRLINSVDIQLRSDIGWPPKHQVKTSVFNNRLGWHLKDTRFFRAFKVKQIKELVQTIQELGYRVTLAECTVWIGNKPSQSLINSQQKMYRSWISLAKDLDCRISFWDWFNGSNTDYYYTGLDFANE